jgi:hypothetical protein
MKWEDRTVKQEKVGRDEVQKKKKNRKLCNWKEKEDVSYD